MAPSFDAHGAKRLGDAGKSGIAVRILLREHRDLPRLQPAYLDQVTDDGVGFLGIAGAVVEDVAIRRIVAQDIGAGERAEEQHPAFERIGDRHRRRRRADIADDAEHLVLFVELLHGLGGARGLVAVVGGEQLEHPAIHAAGIVDPVEGGIDAELHLASEFPGGAGERGCDSKPDFPFGDAAREGAGPGRRNGGRRRGRRLRSGGGGGADGPMTLDRLGPAIDRSRSASWRSARPQSIRPDVTAVRPSVTLRSNTCVRSERSASFDEASRITSENLSTMAWMRGRRDVAAGLCRTNHGSDATSEVAHDIDVTRGAGAVRHAKKQGADQ